MPDEERPTGTAGRARRVLSSRLRRLDRLGDTFRGQNQLGLFGLSLTVGAAAGYATILFRWFIGAVQWVALGGAGERVYSLALGRPWWQLLLAPALGGLVLGLFVRYAIPDRRPLGVAEVMEAVARRGGRMSLIDGLTAAANSAASIGVGASVGREGPVVHLGASLAAWVADRLRLGRPVAVTLLGCAVASAVATSFNAPIAGVFFALEVVVGHYALSAFAPVVMAAVVGTLVSRSHYGDFPAFIVPQYAVASGWEFVLFALLGLASAGMAFAFVRGTLGLQDVVGRLPVPSWARPALGGLVVGAIAVQYPQVLGVGYETTDLALKAQFGLGLLLALCAAKLAATAVSLGFGFGGGVFSPSLVLGALLGSAFGTLVAATEPQWTAGVGAYSLVGMGAVAGVVLGAPISTILIVFELTEDYKITIAVMVAVVVASVVTRQWGLRSFFAEQLRRRGVDAGEGREFEILRTMRVGEIMTDDYVTIIPEAPVSEFRRKLLSAPGGLLLVVDAGGRLRGTISLADLGEYAFDRSLEDLVNARDVARHHPRVLQVDDDLVVAWRVCTESDDARFPVVDNRENMKLVGLLRERDVMLAYQRALLRARAEERGET